MLQNELKMSSRFGLLQEQVLTVYIRNTVYSLPSDFPHTNATRQDTITILRSISVKEMIKTQFMTQH